MQTYKKNQPVGLETKAEPNKSINGSINLTIKTIIISNLTSFYQ